MRKPKSLRTFKKTVQAEFNKMVTDGKPCSKCGKSFYKMDCSHIYSIGAYPNLRFDIMNVLPMCSNCHIWWWHDNPTEAGEWFKKNYGDRYTYLEIAKNIPRNYTIEDLQEVREYIKNKQTDKLCLTMGQIEEYERSHN